MKSNAWLVMAVVCCWFTAIQCVCARTEAGVRAPELPARFLSSESGQINSNQLPASVVCCPLNSLVNSHAVGPNSLTSSKVAELSPDDDGQVDESQPDDKDVRLARLKSSSSAVEWRLSRPDKQRANSFINSKTKPPP